MLIKPLKGIWIFLIPVMLLTGISCNKRITNGDDDLPPPDRINIPAFGEEQSLEIATWNIEQFPKGESVTISNVKEIISDLQIDLYAVQEITDQTAFRMLLDSLSGFDGKLGIANNFPLWTGVIYKTGLFQMIRDTLLFAEDNYNFPRAPFAAYFRMVNGQVIFDFTLVVLHLKAFGDSESQARRTRAIEKLEAYIRQQIDAGGDPDYIIAGDWNDLLEDPPQDNVFLPFLNDTDKYIFLTLPFAGSLEEYSFIGGNYRSLIDHIMITRSVQEHFPEIETKILKIDESFEKYLDQVSDHRPVATKIPLF